MGSPDAALHVLIRDPRELVADAKGWFSKGHVPKGHHAAMRSRARSRWRARARLAPAAQLESPKVGTQGLLTGGLSASAVPAQAGANGGPGANGATGPVFSQFKRRQQTCLPSNLKV